MSKHKQALFALFTLLGFIKPCWHLAAEVQEYQSTLNHYFHPAFLSGNQLFTCLPTAKIQIKSLENCCVLSASQLVPSNPDKSLLHGSGSSPDLAESCWKNFPAPALFSGVETIPWLRALDEMREIGLHFLPTVCIRLLLIFADSILQLFHVVGFYGRIDFLFFFLEQGELDPRLMLFPDFLSLLWEALQTSW